MRQCVRQTEHSVQRKLPEMVPSKRALTMEGFNNKELICITCWYVIACWEYAAALACRNHLLRNFGQSTDRCCIRIPKFQYTPLQEYIMRDILYRIWLRSRAQSKQHFFQWFIRSRVKMKRIMLSGVLCIKNGRNVFTWWLLFKNRTVVLCADECPFNRAIFATQCTETKACARNFRRRTHCFGQRPTVGQLFYLNESFVTTSGLANKRR